MSIESYRQIALSKRVGKAAILIVDDEEITRHLMKTLLSPLYDVFSATSGQEAIDFCQQTPPDIVLLDFEMPVMNGYETCAELKSNLLTQDIPVIFVTAHNDADKQDACWEAGCVDFVTKPYSPKTLMQRINAHLNIKFMADELKNMALRDGLTGLYNRHYFDQQLIEQKRLSARNKTPISLLMIDIDYFKQFNDMYGHLAGDKALQQIAATLTKLATRPTDSITRFGGEEFGIILPDTHAEGAAKVAQ